MKSRARHCVWAKGTRKPVNRIWGSHPTPSSDTGHSHGRAGRPFGLAEYVIVWVGLGLQWSPSILLSCVFVHQSFGIRASCCLWIIFGFINNMNTRSNGRSYGTGRLSQAQRDRWSLAGKLLVRFLTLIQWEWIPVESWMCYPTG